MPHTCKYCDSVFNIKSNLNRHLKQAKYCLELQGKNPITADRIICECGKSYSRKDHLLRHQKTCAKCETVPEEPQAPVSMQDQQTAQLLEMIVQLQKTIANMSERPTNVSNSNNNRNMTMNLAPITDKEIQDHLEHLTIDFIREGAKGYANFANSYPFKDRIICTDKSRKKLRYKDNEGELVDDSGGVKLATRFFQAIAPRNEEIINAEYRSIHEEVQQIARDGTAYCTDLTGLLTKASHLQELLIKCQEAAKGEENELTKEFVNHLSRLL